MQVELYKHQLDAVDKLEVGSILCGGVGSGKSRASIAYFFTRVCRGGIKINGKGEMKPMRSPMDLYIITPAKKRDSYDWVTECARFGLLNDRDVSFGGVSVTVDSWNNISKYEEVKDAFFIFDEQRLVGSGAWVKSFLKITKSNSWILLSATPGDNWLDYIPVFVANGFYKNRSEFLARHVVYNRFAKYPSVERYLDTKHLERLRHRLLVDMPFSRETVRHRKVSIVDYNKEAFNLVMKMRWNVLDSVPIKETGDYFYQMRRIVNTDPSRVDAICEIFETHKRLIIFYNFNYELMILRHLTDILDVPLAEWNGHKHEEIPEADSWIYLVQFTAGADAWNCTKTDTVVFYSLNYSYKNLEQAEGRIDRLDTPFIDLYYYSLQSTAPIDLAINKALKTKKNFNERNFKEK